MRILKKTLLFGLPVLLLLVPVLAGIFGPALIVEIRNPVINFFIPVPTAGEAKPAGLPPYEAFEILAEDDVKIKFLYFKSPKPSKGTILFLHGIRSRKEVNYSVCKPLTDKGFNIVLVDLRAHGESGGKYCTFGKKERKDVQKIVDFLQENFGPSRFGLWGQSLGGAVALQVMAEDPRIRFGVIESTFADFRQVTADYSERFAGFNWAPMTNFFISRAEKMAGFDADSVNPADFAPKINQAVLLVHGENDDRINISHADSVYFKLASKRKGFLSVKGANHVNVRRTGGAELFGNILHFLEKYAN